MNEYEKKIALLFPPNMQKLLLINDIEKRFDQNFLQDLLIEKKFVFIWYENPIKLRYDYEQNVRPKLENGELLNHIIIIPFNKNTTCEIPFDIKENSELIEIGISRIYPKIPSTEGSQIPSKILNEIDGNLSNLRNNINSVQLEEIILQTVLHINRSNWKNPEMILIDLISFFNSDWITESYLVDLISHSIPNQYMLSFCIEQQFPTNRSLFYQWLNQQWEEFVKFNLNIQKKNPFIHFDYHQLKNIISGLIVSNRIIPIEVISDENLPDWIRVGTTIDVLSGLEQRFEELDHLLVELKRKTSIEDLDSVNWDRIIKNLAELEFQIPQLKDESKQVSKFLGYLDQIDEQFGKWMITRYLSLHMKSSFQKPNFISQILPFLEKKIKKENQSRMTLLVIDGMSNLAWEIIKKTLHFSMSSEISVIQVFSEIPSITRICRTSLLGGIPPWGFEPHLLSKLYEEKQMWDQFWSDKQRKQTNYIRFGLGMQNFSEFNEQLDSNSNFCIILDDLDRIVHSSITYSDLFMRIKEFSGKTLEPLINLLLNKGYWIYITADHGFRRCSQKINLSNLLSKQSKLFLQSKGGRFLISERNEPESEFIYNVSFKQLNNTDQNWLYLAKGSYTMKINIGFDHGGISITECLVPFIQIKQNSGVNDI